MANDRIKISQLTPKGANLASTDLLEISEYNGSGYITKSITGQEIIDAASGGGGDMLKSVYDPDDTGIVLSASKEMVSVINKTGGTVSAGTIVYLKSTSSSATHPEILLADADTEATSTKTIGAVYEDILSDEIGYVVTSGEVDNLNTGMYNIGDKLWLSQTPGEVTTTPPVQPAHTVFIGTVTRSQGTNGRILYAIQNGYELNELHDVLITSVANNDIIQYDSASLLWKNESLSTAGIQPTLVSGTNIKTINSTSLVGSGNVSVQPTLVAGTNIKYVNGFSLLGSGDLLTPVGIHGFTKPTTGLYLSTTLLGTTSSFAAITGVANRLTVYPFIATQDITIQALTIYVNTLVAGALARIVLYVNTTLNGGDYPGTKAWESSNLDCSTLGMKTASLSFTFNKGQIYWLGVHVSANAAILGCSQTNMLSLGFNGVSQNYCHLNQSTTFGSLPSNFGTGFLQSTAPPQVFLQMV